MGSPPATFTCIAVPVVMLTLSLRSFRQHYHGLLRGHPSGVSPSCCSASRCARFVSITTGYSEVTLRMFLPHAVLPCISF